MAFREAQAAGARFYTIGHSTRSSDELLALLAEHGIEKLVDVRTMPRSRHNPQFNRDDFDGVLAAAGISYRHAADLGGLRKPRPDSPNDGWKHPAFRAYADHMQSQQFAAAMDALSAEIAESPTAVMCAESLPWRCHRWLIADAALVRAIDVTHIVGANRSQPHQLTSFAEVADGGLRYPFALT